MHKAWLRSVGRSCAPAAGRVARLGELRERREEGVASEIRGRGYGAWGVVRAGPGTSCCLAAGGRLAPAVAGRQQCQPSSPSKLRALRGFELGATSPEMASELR